MRKIYLVFLGLFLCADAFSATARSSNAIVRSDQNSLVRQIINRSKQTTTDRSIISRTASTQSQKNKKERSSTKIISARSASKKTIPARAAYTPNRISRAATSTTTHTFGNGYETCRDAYFTCMDQFCANQNDTYRRCVCSSRLQDIQKKENLLSQTSTSLQDFHDFNVNAIDKTAKEVQAMQSASVGEQSLKEDKSSSAITLKNVKDVLNTSKQNALSTNGTFDIAGDIQSIWETTDLIRGYDISTLSGESLYNAVHAQCSALVAEQCVSSDLKMIASAYGMYIENDCEVFASDLNKRNINANAAIRTSRHEMQDKRLETYNAHNALSVTDCIAQVRKDITADTACGDQYIHCLDTTGKYLNITTGAPIYSSDFYQFENQLSLSGDVLTNSKNTAMLNVLNKKKTFAQKTLDTCRNVSDNVWEEFLRQALVEIYQGQANRVKEVKAECMQVVTQCYLDKSDTLNSLAEDVSDISTRQNLEITEELCKDKLTTCSNLYGGGPEGMALLISTMTKITDATIAQECPALLESYAEQVCAVSNNDVNHTYPYGCRFYAPGESKYAREQECNQYTTKDNADTDTWIEPTDNTDENLYPICPTNATKTYTSCKVGFYLQVVQEAGQQCPATPSFTLTGPKKCCPCPGGYICAGGIENPTPVTNTNIYEKCGLNYVGSLYQLLVRYALQNCTRSTNTEYVLPESILANVNTVMTSIYTSLAQQLSSDCSALNGIWVSLPWQDNDKNGKHDKTGHTLLHIFYQYVNANKLWGYCRNQ